MPKRLIHPVRNWRLMSAEEQLQIRNLLIVIVPVMILVMVTLVLFTATFTQPLRAAAPFVFSAPSYAPSSPADGRVCPGDTLEWPVAFTVQRAPVMVISIRSIWDVDDNQTVTLPPGNTFNAGSLNFTNYTEVTSVERTAKVVIPDLAPGQYQIRSAVQEFNSQAAAYFVSFEVKDGC